MACLHIPTPTAALPCPPPSSVFPRSTSISANKLYLLIMSTLEKYRAEYLEHPWTQPMTHSPTAHCIAAAAAAAGTDGYLTRLTLPCTSTTFSMIRVINCATHLFAPIFHSCSLIFIPVRLVQTWAGNPNIWPKWTKYLRQTKYQTAGRDSSHQHQLAGADSVDTPQMMGRGKRGP